MSRVIWLIVALLAVPLDVLAQSGPTAVLDLATPVTAQPITAGETVQVRIENSMPGGKYRIQIERRDQEIPPLDPPNATRAAVACSNLAEQFTVAAANAKSEQAVAQQIRTFKSDAAQCTQSEQKALADAIKNNTTKDLGAYKLSKGERLIVKIQRDDQSWEFTLSTGERGQWRTFYGFTFLPNEDEGFFTRQDASNADQFIITPEKDREQLDFAPSILFVWSPSGTADQTWNHGLTAGLGFDMDDPIVFAGYALTFNENIAFTIGVVLHKRERLAGRYESGEIVAEDLDSEQLVEETYGVNGYVGVAFRFGSNPFSREQE